MVKTLQSHTQGRGKKMAIVVSRFNDFVTKRLLEGCLQELERCGVEEKNITVVWVPGSYEIPLTALTLAKKKNIDAVICLGAVIRGETFHFELIARAAAEGILQASLLSGKPVIFGVLTTDTVAQAYKRSEKKGDNKGRDAAGSALQMIELLSQIKKN